MENNLLTGLLMIIMHAMLHKVEISCWSYIIVIYQCILIVKGPSKCGRDVRLLHLRVIFNKIFLSEN